MSKRTASPAKSAGPQDYRKPNADIYTLLLLVASLFVVAGTIALWMTMKEDYDNAIKGGPTPVWHRPATSTVFDPQRGIA